MKEFDWSEVVEYLNDNLDKRFNYGNSCSNGGEPQDGCCRCLMASFFDFKGVSFVTASFRGLEALKNGEQVALVKNSPVTLIRQIHVNEENRSLCLGRDIKNKLDEITKQQ